MRVKNNKSTSDVWVGQTILAGAEYDLEPIEVFKWQSDSKVISDLNSLNLLIGDGLAYKSSNTESLNYLFGADTDPKDSTGRRIFRPAITTDGYRFNPNWIEIITSKLNGVINVDENLSDLGQCTSELYKSDGSLITDQTTAELLCTKTVITFTPHVSHEPIGGMLFQNAAPITDVRLFIKAYPLVQPTTFGNGGINLRLIGITGTINLDGKATKYMPYIPGVVTWQFTLQHNPGVKHEFALLMELFSL